MSVSVLIVISVLVMVSAVEAMLVNWWQETFNFTCKPGQAISRITSIYSRLNSDRRFEYACRSIGETVNCWNSGSVNDYKNPTIFYCPGEQIITGFVSFYSLPMQDRLFSFRCCDVMKKVMTKCEYTGEIHEWAKRMDLVVRYGHAIRAAIGNYNATHPDRQWGFEICEVQNV